MKRAMYFVLALCMALLVPEIVQAQVALSSASGPNFSLTNSTFPTYRYPVVTITGSSSPTTAKFSIGSVNRVVVRVTGTYSASNVTIQASNDNTNFTTVPLIPITAPGAQTFALTGASTAVNGLYYITNVGAMTQLQVTTAATFTGTSMILTMTGTALPGFDASADPCQDKNVQKSSAAITGTSPTVQKVVAGVAGKNIYVCDVNYVGGTGNTSWAVTTGTTTSTNCDTTTVSLSGAMGLTVGQQGFLGWGGTIFGPSRIPAGNDVCIAPVGGTAAFAGSMTYVQQ